jgi:hypothetical protein
VESQPLEVPVLRLHLKTGSTVISSKNRLFRLLKKTDFAGMPQAENRDSQGSNYLTSAELTDSFTDPAHESVATRWLNKITRLPALEFGLSAPSIQQR